MEKVQRVKEFLVFSWKRKLFNSFDFATTDSPRRLSFPGVVSGLTQARRFGIIHVSWKRP
jgi:hypothetical protein